MSSSHNAFPIPVHEETPTPLPTEVPDKPVELCETCWEAHYTALCDNGTAWAQDNDHVILDNCFTESQTLHTDVWPSLPRLHDLATTGCGFCAFLQDAILSRKFNETLERMAEGTVRKAHPTQIGLKMWYSRTVGADRFPQPQPRALRYLTVSITFGGEFTVYLGFKLEAMPGKRPSLIARPCMFAKVWLIVADSRAVAEWLLLTPPAILSYEDDEITSFLTTELRKCPVTVESYHDNTDFLPKRLIDVGVNSLRLVEGDSISSSAGSAQRPQYCALSYCWGPREYAESQTKTTRENLERHLERLNFRNLSQVLKDAVETARRLCIPYLWVDSLCILQDDISDWRKQCTQMNDIYGKARVTLIAASSRTCTEGFLNPKRRGLRFPYQSASRPDIRGWFMMYFTHALGSLTSFRDIDMIDDLHHDLTLSKWASRGWTFQEYAMTSAHIVFGKFNVYFGRDNRYVCNNGPAGFVDPPKSVTSLQSNGELHRAWENVVHRYSAFTTPSFTNPMDVLPALSGLARLFGNMLQVEYVAGYWMERLHCSLMWTVSSNSFWIYPSLDHIIMRHGRKPYLIPTWSGLTRGRAASVLDYDTSSCQSEIDIVKIHMKLIGEDPYGAIEDACLTLEGSVLDLASLSWSEWPKRLVGSMGNHAEEIYFKEENFKAMLGRYIEFIISNRERTSDSEGDQYHYRMRLDFKVESGNRSLIGKLRGSFEQLISRLTMLLLGCETIYEDDVLKNRQAYGLVLASLGGASERSFLRVGTFYPERCRQKDRQRDSQQDSLPCLKRLMKKETIKIF